MLFRNWSSVYLANVNLSNMRWQGKMVTYLNVLHQGLREWRVYFFRERLGFDKENEYEIKFVIDKN